MGLILGGEEFIHFVQVVDASPGGVGVFRVGVASWNFEKVHSVVDLWVDVSIKAAKHHTFFFCFHYSLQQGCFIVGCILEGVELSLGEELAPMFLCVDCNLSEETFGACEVGFPVDWRINKIYGIAGVVDVDFFE